MSFSYRWLGSLHFLDFLAFRLDNVLFVSFLNFLFLVVKLIHTALLDLEVNSDWRLRWWVLCRDSVTIHEEFK